MIEAIFWDNDGILVDTEHLYFRATQQVLASVGVVFDEQAYHDLLLAQSVGAWHLAAEKGIGPAHIERLQVERNDLYSRLLEAEARAMDGAETVLQTLYGRLAMGVVTSSRRTHFEIIHRATGFTRFFDFVVANGDYARSKPQPDPYLKALEQTGYNPDACVVVEDSQRGLMAAKAAGLTCWVIPTPLTQAGDFSSADRVLEHITDVLTCLDLS